jgi:hypothetical protein
LKDAALVVVSLVIDYIRWTQMVPMVLAWGMVVIALFAAVFVSFQEESVIGLVWLHQKTAVVPGLHEWLSRWVDESGVQNERGGLHLSDRQLLPMIATVWAVLSGCMMLLSSISRWLRGPHAAARWPLSVKLVVAGAASCVAIAMLGLVLHAGGAAEDVGGHQALTTSAIAAAILWFLSAYGLAVSHVLNAVLERFSLSVLLKQ